MRTYGPTAFTVNTPFRIGIDSTAVAVQIHNNSGLSLRVYFGAAAPSTSSDAAHWHATISPGSHPVLSVNANIGYFDGTVSFFPFSEQGAPSQASGFIGASSVLTLEAYFPGEQLPQSVYSPVFQQGAAQQRSVAVPMPSLVTNAALLTPLSQASTFPLMWDDTPVSQFYNVFNRQAPTGGGVVVAFYLHDLDIRFEGGAAGYNAFHFAIECVHLSAAQVLKSGPVKMYDTLLGSTGGIGGADRDTFTRSSPSPTQLIITTGTSILVGDLFAIRFRSITTAGTWALYPNIGWSVDVTNSAQLDPFGAGFNNSAASALNPRTY